MMVCMMCFFAATGFAQGINTAPPSPVTVVGTLISNTNVTTTIKAEYAANQAIAGPTVEPSAATSTALNRMMLLEATHIAWKQNGNDLEQAVVRAYTGYAEKLNRNITAYTSDPDFQYLVGVVTQ